MSTLAMETSQRNMNRSPYYGENLKWARGSVQYKENYSKSWVTCKVTCKAWNIFVCRLEMWWMGLSSNSIVPALANFQYDLTWLEHILVQLWKYIRQLVWMSLQKSRIQFMAHIVMVKKVMLSWPCTHGVLADGLPCWSLGSHVSSASLNIWSQ